MKIKYADIIWKEPVEVIDLPGEDIIKHKRTPVFLCSDFEKAKKRFLNYDEYYKWYKSMECKITYADDEQQLWFAECFGVEK